MVRDHLLSRGYSLRSAPTGRDTSQSEKTRIPISPWTFQSRRTHHIVPTNASLESVHVDVKMEETITHDMWGASRCSCASVMFSICIDSGASCSMSESIVD